MKRISITFIPLTVALHLCLSCSLLSLDYKEKGTASIGETTIIDWDDSDFAWAGDDWTQMVIRRATQMATIKWVPLLDVPYNGGSFGAGMQVTGIPYSSTKKINKYIGFDVSYLTFMTAVHNPYSVLYTENIGKPPYDGVNCACYYGTVCSAAVAYALGLAYPLVTSLYPTDGNFEEVTFHGLEDLQLGDVLQRTGHVLMIYRLYKDEKGVITRVTIFEAAGVRAALVDYSSESFLQRIREEGLRPFRYNRLIIPSAHTASIGSEFLNRIVYNEYLCPNKGDRSVYRSDESVVIDVFDSWFDTIVLSKDGEEYLTRQIDGVVNDMGVLEPGQYSVCLRRDGQSSDTVELIVADPIVHVSITDRVHISFECEKATPLYCVYATETGDSRYTHVFDEVESIQGFCDLDLLEGGPYYYKVVFDTPFGTVINDPICIR